MTLRSELGQIHRCEKFVEWCLHSWWNVSSVHKETGRSCLTQRQISVRVISRLDRIFHHRQKTRHMGCIYLKNLKLHVQNFFLDNNELTRLELLDLEKWGVTVLTKIMKSFKEAIFKWKVTFQSMKSVQKVSNRPHFV